jgi:4,5:9,10-diseco-3-hydroxy-5,9,17-trioxoandrosta-1(10),2-diene-4-oate hydrolase
MSEMALGEEATSRYLQAGGLRIHYHEAGTGYPLVCIHGGGPGASGWSNFRRNLGELSQHFRTVLVDLPGYGQSDKVPVQGSPFLFYATAVRDFMDALGIQRAHLLGNSLGGAVALRLAAEWPQRAQRLVLMGPAGLLAPFNPQPAEGIKFLHSYYQPPGPSLERLRAFVDVMVYDPSQVTEQLLQERYRASIQPEVMANPPLGWHIARAMQEERLWALLPRVPHPTLVIWGRDDRVVPLDNAFIALRLLPDVRLHVFANCGHWAQWERAREFNRLVIDFLAAQDGRDGERKPEEV